VTPPAGFVVSQPSGSSFVADGLRPYFTYRDLGLKGATAERAVAHVIRARDGHAAAGEWHYHEVELQIVYVLRGWVRFEYEGVGEVQLEPGSFVHQPPCIRHRELAHSADLELLEIVIPADFKTVTLP